MSGFILVAVEGEGENACVIGFAHVLENEGAAHLDQLSVIPSRTGHGHGRALVAATMNEAAERARRAGRDGGRRP